MNGFWLNAAGEFRKRSLSGNDVTRNHLKNGHKKTIGTDFYQFCAACELIFSRPIKCCSRKYNIKKCCLGIENKLNAAREIKNYRNSDWALKFLQSAAARWHQRPSWPWNHIFEKSRYLSYFSNIICIVAIKRFLNVWYSYILGGLFKYLWFWKMWSHGQKRESSPTLFSAH